MRNTSRIIALVLTIIMIMTENGAIALAETIFSLPSAMQIIEEEAFYGDTTIDKIELPNNAKEIHAKAFAYSTLSKINLPDSLTYIADDAFEGLEHVDVTVNPGTYAYIWAVKHHLVETEDESGDNEADAEAPTAEHGSIRMDGDFVFESFNGKATLLAYQGHETELRIPYYVGSNLVNGIGANFLGADSTVKDIIIPGNVTKIDDHSFDGVSVTIEGWNGTEALRFANRLGYEAVNRSNVTAYGFDKNTIDYSYLEPGKVTVLSETAITLGIGEIELLYEGATFYSPDDNRVYLVEAVDKSQGLAKIIKMLPKSSTGSVDGDWIYEIVDGYARVLGYTDKSAARIVIPDELGGVPVNSIGEKAFVDNTALERITIHGNVVQISEDAFASSSVCIQGYNGTTALKYAKRMHMPSTNITDLQYYQLQENVVDFSYTFSDRYDYQSEYVIQMRPAEAAQLGVGSLFYVPMYYGNIMRFYKVTDIVEDVDWTYLSVEEAPQGEALAGMSFDDLTLYADWEHAEYAEGVVVSEEKGWLSDAFDWTKEQVKKLNKVSFSPEITYTPKHLSLEMPIGKAKGEAWSASAKLFAEMDITFKGSVSGEFTIVPLEMNKFGLKLGADLTAKGGFSAGVKHESTDKKTKATMAGKMGYACKDLLLAKVPLLTAAGAVSVTAGIYIKVALNGEITVYVKGSGDFVNYQFEKGKNPSNDTNFKFEGPTFTGSASVAVGPQFSLALTIAALGDLVSFDVFLGLDCSASITLHTISGELDLSSYTGEIDFSGFCSDVKVSVIFEVGLEVKIPGLKDINWAQEQKNDGVQAKNRKKRTVFELAGHDVEGLTTHGFGIKIFSFEGELVKLHFEGDSLGTMKEVEHCTRGLKTVTFNLGNGKDIDRKVATNGKIEEPDFENGFAVFFLNFVDLKNWYIKDKDKLGELRGWYYYEGCAGPGEFSKGKGTRRYWDFDNDTITADTTLYADWEGMKGNTHSVTYHWNYEDSVPQNERNNDWTDENMFVGSVLQEPENIMRMNYRLKGWYKDAAGTEKWKFATDTMPDMDLDLYAIWEKNDGYDPWAVQQSTGNYGVEYNGHRYWHIADYYSYSAAQDYAKQYGGYLVTINDAGEQAFLAQYVDRDCAQTYLWLGITAGKNWNFWNTGEAVRYSNWISGEPQNGTGHYYGAIIRDDGHWTTLAQDATAHFVIEFGGFDTDPANQTNTNSNVFQYEIDSVSGDAYVSGVDAQALADLYKKGESAAINSVYTDNGGGSHTVTQIKDKAFANTSLKSIVLPNTIRSIGNEAFKDCKQLEKIVIPSSVTQIGNSAFSGCTGMISAVWGNSLKSIPYETFRECINLQDVSNINHVTAIENSAFYNCNALVGFTYPDSLTTIGSGAFYNCRALRSIKLPDKVTSIGNYAFQNCTTASVITLPAGLTYVNYNVFSGCSTVTDVFILSRDSFSCNGNPFSSCTNATFNVYMHPSNGSTAETEAWKWCRNNLSGRKIVSIGGSQRVSFSAGEKQGSDITSKAGEMIADAYIVVGGRITEPVITREGMTLEGWYLDPDFKTKWNFATGKMPDYAITLYAKWIDSQEVFNFDVVNGKAVVTGYKGNNSDVVVPDLLTGYPVTTIDEGAFSGSDILSITLPATVRTIRGAAFDCANLTDIILLSNKYFTVHEDGVLYNAKGTALIYALPGRALSSYQVPDTVTTIYKGAFAGQPALRKCYIPDSVIKIYDGAFAVGDQLTLYGGVDTCAAKTYAKKNLYRYNVYLVTFYDGNDVLTYMMAEAGTKLENLPQPQSTTARFISWCRDPELQQPFDMQTEVMPNEDLALYIKYDSLFTYTNNAGQLTIKGYKGTETDVVIPETIMDLPVVGIASKAFSAAKYTSVTIPDCVTTISDSAFNSTLTLRGNTGSTAYTYAKANSLKFQVLKYTVTFNSWGGSLIDDMKVKPGTKLTLPVPVRTGYYFFGWYTDTTFTDEVEWTANTKMPAEDVTLFAHWKIANPNITGQFGIQPLEDGSAEIISYSGTKTVLSVPDTINGYSISRIGDSAFKDNETVMVITLPETVTSIGRNAFANSVVETVKGATNVTVIEDSAFSGAASLTGVDFSERLEYVGNSSFAYCNSLTDMSFKDGLRSIGDYAFYACQYLDSVTLPSTLGYIGAGAFKACPRLAKLKVPVAVIGNAALFTDEGVAISSTGSTAVNIQKWNRVTAKEIYLEWNLVERAASYEIYRKGDTSRYFHLVTSVSDTSYSYKGTFTGKSIQLMVKALDENGTVICESAPIEVLLTTLDTPAVASVTQSSDSSARMVLTGVNGAEGYEIWRARSESGSFSLLKSVTTLSFNNTGLSLGEDYYYRVRAYATDESGEMNYSNWSEVFRFHMPKAYLRAVQGIYARQYDENRAILTWNEMDGADSYVIYRSLNGGAYKVWKDTKEAKYTFTLGQYHYSFKVAARIEDDGQTITGALSEAAEITLNSIPTPEILSISELQTLSFTVKWATVPNVTGYYVYRSDQLDGQYVRVKSTTSNSSVITGNTADTDYWFKVQAYVKGEDNKITKGEMSRAVACHANALAKVTLNSVSQTATGQVTLQWGTLKDALGYEVLMSAGSDKHFESQGITTSTSMVVKELRDGATYTFKVRAYTGEAPAVEYGAESNSLSVTIIGTPEISVIEQYSDTSIQIMWDAVDGADGYEIWSRDKASGNSYTLRKRCTETKYINTKLTANNRYYYLIRAYRIVDNERVYGFYGEVKSKYIFMPVKISAITRTGTTSAKLTWERVSGAKGYDVYRSYEKNGSYTRIAQGVTTPYYENTDLKMNTIYYYKVVPYVIYNGEDEYGRMSGALGIRMLTAPKLERPLQIGAQMIRLTWSAVEGATSYNIYEATSENGTYVMKMTSKSNAVSIDSLTQKKRYYYKITACSNDSSAASEGLPSNVEMGFATALDKPVLNEIAQISSSTAELSWSKIPKSTGYEISRAEQADGYYEVVKHVDTTTCRTSSMTVGNDYYFRIRPYYQLSTGETVYGMYSKPVGVRMIDTVSISAVELMSATSIKLAWQGVNGATSYRVFMSDGGDFTEVKTTTNTTLTMKGLEVGKSYSFKVAAAVKDGNIYSLGRMSSGRTVTMVSLAAPNLNSVLQTDGGAVTLSWNAVSDATGYQVLCAKGSEPLAVKKTTTKTSATVTGLEDGETYTFVVRAYVLIDGSKKYGPNSLTRDLTLLNAPSFSAVYQSSSTEITLVWPAVSGATAYQIERKTNSGSFKSIGTTADTTYTDGSLTVGTVYTYRIRACMDAVGGRSCSAYSNAVALTPIDYSADAYPESAHEYANNMDTTWTYSIPGANALVMKFSDSTLFENNYDKLYVTDSSGNPVRVVNGRDIGRDYFTGSELAGGYVTVPSGTVTLRLKTDSSVTKYGFSFDFIRPSA